MSYETVHLVVEAKQRGEEAYNVRQNRSGIRIFVVGWMGRWIENHIYIFYLFLFFSFLFLILLNDLHTSSGWVLCRFKNDLVFIFFSYFIFGSLIDKWLNIYFFLSSPTTKSKRELFLQMGLQKRGYSDLGYTS